MTEMLPLKRLVDPARPITYGIVQAGPNIEDGVPYIRPVDMVEHSGVPTPLMLNRTSHEIAAAYRRSILRAGDVIVSIGPSYGKTMVVPDELAGANLTQGTARIAPRAGVDARFLFWALQSSSAVSHWEASVGGATFRALNLGPLEETPVANFPFERQRAIADFLTVETVHMDALIAKKRRMAELLHEAEISRCEELIGWRSGESATSRWRVVRNKNILCEINEPSLNGDDDLLTVSHITGVGRRAEHDVSMFLAESLVGYRRIEPGDLAINTMWAWMGALGVSEVRGIVSPAYGTYRFDPTIAWPRFFHYLFRSPAYVQEMTRFSTGVWSSRLRLYPDVFLSLTAPLPPIEEQKLIAAKLDDGAERSRTLSQKLDRQIQLLQERRQAVITAAVTGQIATAA